MPIISVDLMNAIDEREMQKITKEKQTKTEKRKGNISFSGRAKAKWFYCVFKILKLGLRSISRRITSLIFSNIYTPPQHALIHIILCFFK